MGEKTTWERTAVQNLLRNQSSRKYYGRWKIAGKQKWVPLDTDVISFAKIRLNDEAGKNERLRGNRAAVTASSTTMAELMAIYEERSKAHPELRPASISWRLAALTTLRKTWPRLAVDELPVARRERK